MKALIAHPQHWVEFADVAAPELQDDQALVQVDAFSPNRGETFLLETPPANWRPGKDIAGHVIQPARNGLGPQAGQRIVAHLPHSGWAEQVAVNVKQLVALPENISVTQAASLPLAGLTALRLLRVAGPVMSQRILLTGASGGVGHYFTELAARAGAEVTAVTSTPERGQNLLALGAQQVIQEVSQAEGLFDVGLESVGGSSMAQVLTHLSDTGRLIWFGQASRTPPTLNFFDWTNGANATIRKFSYAEGPQVDERDLTTLVRLAERGNLHPQVGLSAPWQQASQVIDDLVNRRIVGNAVLTIQ